MAKLKRGKYSVEEEKYIVDNVHKFSSHELAHAINRSPVSVEAFIKRKGLKTVSTSEEQEELDRLIGVLHSSPHWPKVLLALTDKEKEMFESDWINIVRQFGEDVWYTEQMYVVDWLLLNVKKYRTLKFEKEALQEIERIETELDIEYKLDEDLRDNEKIIKMEEELALQKSAVTQHTNQLKIILEQMERKSDKLKANREDRRDIKANEDTYWGYIAMLEDEKFRKQEARQAQLMKMAQDKAREDLYQYHEYMDGEVDIPLLTPEIVLRNREQEKNEKNQQSNV